GGGPEPDLDSSCSKYGREGARCTCSRSKGFGRKMERLSDVLGFQVGIEIQDLGRGNAARHHIDNNRHRNAQATNAGGSAELMRVCGDAGERHRVMVAPCYDRKRPSCAIT